MTVGRRSPRQEVRTGTGQGQAVTTGDRSRSGSEDGDRSRSGSEDGDRSRSGSEDGDRSRSGSEEEANTQHNHLGRKKKLMTKNARSKITMAKTGRDAKDD